MALAILSDIFFLPPSFSDFTFFVVASRRGVGFLGTCSYCDVIVSAFSTYVSFDMITKPLHLSEGLTMISDFERSSSNACLSSPEWFVLLVLWFFKQAMILFLSNLSDRSVGASEGGAILVSVSLHL